MIIRAVTCLTSPPQGADHSCHYFGFHRSPHLDIDHSCCDFRHISPHQAIIIRTVTFVARYHIGTWVISAALCHSSHIRTLFIRAVAYVTHYHIRTDIIRSVTSVTHYHTWTLIICAVLNPISTSAIAHSCSPCHPPLHQDIYNSCCHFCHPFDFRASLLQSSQVPSLWPCSFRSPFVFQSRSLLLHTICI